MGIVRNLRRSLRSLGLTIDDGSQAFAGRVDANEPPCAVLAVRLLGSPAGDLPPWVGVGAEAIASTGWATVEVAGRAVRRGTPEMIGQDEHLRGTPYAYDRDDTHYVVTSDRDDWVTDALCQPAVATEEPDPCPGRARRWARATGAMVYSHVVGRRDRAAVERLGLARRRPLGE